MFALAERAPGATAALLELSARVRSRTLDLSAVARLNGRIHELAAQVHASRDKSSDGREIHGIKTLMRGFPGGFESGVAHVALAYAVMSVRDAHDDDVGRVSSDSTDLDALETRS